ncbi:hypothetical protein Acor_64820 [Acrocarpospora corrugata]|uniref:Uncharacterized protein n=1 Tax=Acrocarpospora corrugata TaxID=35763 RepID=A0A5M3W6I4_9ACTN|nr:hypothetical protein Acor_64820 [Acrocarpospora corrugata]
MPKCGAYVLQAGVVQWGLRVDRGVAGREQEIVALPQREFHRLAEPYNHGAAGSGAAAFHEAEVALRRARAQGEVELAETAALPG